MPNANVFVLLFTAFEFGFEKSLNICYQNSLIFVVGVVLLMKSFKDQIECDITGNVTSHSKAPVPPFLIKCYNVEHKMVKNPNKFIFLIAICRRKEQKRNNSSPCCSGWLLNS